MLEVCIEEIVNMFYNNVKYILEKCETCIEKMLLTYKKIYNENQKKEKHNIPKAKCK